MESKCFNDALDEQLIHLVRMHPALYQSGHKSYKDNPAKENIWDEIALSLDRTVSECKMRWRTIRDSYRKTQKRLQLGCRTKSKYNTENLKFLERVTKYSREESISPSQNEPEEAVSEENSELPDVAVEVETGTVDKDSKNHVYNQDNRGDDHDMERDKSVISRGFQRSETLSKASTSLKSVMQQKKRQKLVKEKILEEVKKGHEDRKRVSKDLLSEEKFDTAEHPVEMFFRSMAKIVMTFPPHLIAETRSKVCSIISEMELRSLAEQNVPGFTKCHNL